LHCASNEKEVRAICKEEGIKVLGTISILIEAIRIKLIDNSSAEKMLNHMKKSTMYLDEALYLHLFWINKILISKIDQCRRVAKLVYVPDCGFDK